MDCLIRTVSIKLPSLLTITTDGNLQIVSVYLNSDNVDISADTPVSSGIANKPVSSLSLPQVIDTSINSPSTNPISVEQKTERNVESAKMPESNINIAKPHTINLTNFLGSANIDTDAPDDDLRKDDVLQKEDVFHKTDEWTKVQKGNKHSTPGCSGDAVSKRSGGIMTQNMFGNFASAHVDDDEDDNGNHGIAFTQERGDTPRTPTSDDVSRMSSNTSNRHRDVNSLTPKEFHTIVDRELKRLRNKSDTLMLKHKASVKDTCNGYLIQMNETFTDLTEEFENDFLERKDEFAKALETERNRLDKDIVEMQYQRGLLKDFHKLLEGTKSNMESDFLKRIESKLDARVKAMLDDETHKNSSFRETLNQDIDYLRCDIHDMQQFIPTDESHPKKNIFQDMNDLAVTQSSLIDRISKLEDALKTKETTHSEKDAPSTSKPKKRLFENVRLDDYDEGPNDDGPNNRYGLRPLLPYPVESRVRYKFLSGHGSQQGQECYILSYDDREDDRWYKAATMSNTMVSFPESCITEVIQLPQTPQSCATTQHHQSPPVQMSYNHNGSPIRPPPYLRDQNDNNTGYHRDNRHLHEDDFVVLMGDDGRTKVTKRVKETQLTSFDKAPDRIVVLNTKNAKEFYNSLRLVISPYNIPLVDWSQITDALNILDLDPAKTGNYVSARQVMARALYRFFDRHKEEIFDSTTHFGDSLVIFEKSLDGIGFLSDFVALTHPNVVKSAYHSNTTIETLTSPTYSAKTGLFTFLRNCEKYFEENPGKTFLFQTKFVKESLATDKRFADVLTTLISRMHPYIEKNTGYLPPELQLSRLSSFFQVNMTPDALASVCRPDNADTNTTINAVQHSRGRHNSRPHEHQRKKFHKPKDRVLVEDVTDDEGEPSGKTKLCGGCGGYGHTEEECKAIGKIIHINEWLKTLSSTQRRQFLQAYRKDKFETHQRYLAGLKSRKRLKLKINRLQYDASHSIGIQHYDADLNDQIEKEIQMAKEKEPNIDFGSADPTYCDLNEMEPDFNDVPTDIDLE